MSERLYKIVFRGELAVGLSTEDVAANLKERFKFSDAALARLFSGRAMVLKSGMDDATARKYARALDEAGACCTVEPMEAATSSPQPATAVSPEPAPLQETMVCPKCGQSQPESEICAGCGVVVAKARQRQNDAWAGGGMAPAVEAAGEGDGGPGHAVATENVLQSLSGTRPWVRLVSILLFIGAGLGLLGALFSTVAMRHAPGGPPIALVAVFQVLTCALYLFPAFFLYKYADAIGVFLRGRQIADLERALGYQRAFWKFIGILTAVMMALAALGIVAAVMIPMLAS